MKKPPYSLSEAENICKEFQSLAGQRFNAETDATIDCITVSPFDQINKNRFIIYYLLFDDAQIALQQDYQGLLFDVIAIAGSKEGQEMLHEDLHTWLTRNKSLPCHPIEMTHLAPQSSIAAYR